MSQKNQFVVKGECRNRFPKCNLHYLLFLFVLITLCLMMHSPLLAQEQDSLRFAINLKSRKFMPVTGVSTDTVEAIQVKLSRIMADTLLARVGKVHILVQLERIPNRREKEDIKRYGVQFLNYIPNNTWIIAVSQDVKEAISKLERFGLRWVGRLTPEDKASDEIKEKRLKLLPDSLAILLVQVHRTVPLEIGKELVIKHGGIIKREVKTINSLIITIPVNNINSLIEENYIIWAEQAPPPLEGTNDGIRFMTNVDIVNAAPYDLDGDGVSVLVFDGGLVDDNHPDFGTRVTHGEASVDWAGTIGTVEDHPTHVAGTLGGDGSQSAGEGGALNQWRGMAPAVSIISYGNDWDGTDVFLYNNLGDLEEDFEEAIDDHNVDIATASVGTNVARNNAIDPVRFNCNMEGDYEATSQLIDNIVRGSLGRPLITTWAAGNERRCPTTATCGNMYNTINPPASAKNPIHVGAVYSDDNSMTDFSGWGPTDDGRLKPTIVAHGCVLPGNCPAAGVGITSTVVGGVYGQMCGTSMATPAVAGIVSLMLQQYRATYDTDERPLPSTMKAILVHTAQDWWNVGPDFRFGYGIVNAQAAVDLIRSGQPLFVESQINDPGEEEIFLVDVPNGQTEFNVTLAWDDVPGLLNTAPEIQNDLDLTLEAPDGTISYPWILDPSAGNEGNAATTGTDDLNNQEQVHVANPDEGTWKIRVTGTTVPEPIQKYSLVSDFPLKFYQNVSVVQVIDRTGSMNYRDISSAPTYMESAKIGAQNFIGLMRTGDQIGVVSYDDEGCDNSGTKAEARFNLSDITFEAVKNSAIASIDALSARGCTSIGAGLQLGQEGPNFLDSANPDLPHVMVLLTDGFENTSPMVSDVIDDIPEETDIYSIALGPHSDSDLMKEIASSTGGKFYESPTILGLLSIYYQIQGDVEAGQLADLALGTKAGGNDTRLVTIDPDAREATFAIGWLQKTGKLWLSLTDPNGNPINPSANPNVEEGSNSTYHFIRVKNPLAGEWQVRILRVDKGNFLIDYTFAAFVNGVSKLWSFVPEIIYAGDCLLTKVHLYDNRTLQPIKDATVNAVLVSPQTYKYTLNYQYVKPGDRKWRPGLVTSPMQKTNKTISSVTSGDMLPTWSTTLRYYDQKSIKETDKSIFKYDTTRVTLFDNGTHSDEQSGDGVYTNCIAALKVAGSYNISFSISGVTPSGATFKRRSVTTSSMMPGKVDSSKTLVRVDPSIIDVKEGSECTITIVPIDLFGNVWGPGFSSKIKVSTTLGQLSGDLQDNGDGFYFQMINSTGVQGIGEVTVMVDGVEMRSKPSLMIGTPYRKFSLSIHGGIAVPIDNFADDFEQGYNVLVDLDYHFTPELSFVGFFGYNDFKSKTAGIDDNYWMNVSANIKYREQLRPKLFFYFNGGPGYYIPETGDSRFGLNLGAGFNYDYTNTINFELGADYHTIFDEGIQFVHSHAGVVIRF